MIMSSRTLNLLLTVTAAILLLNISTANLIRTKRRQDTNRLSRVSIELPLLEEMAVYDGETGVVLPCVIQGDMGDDYWLHWYKDDERINTAQNAAASSGAYKLGTQRYQMKIRRGLLMKKTSKEAQGRYRCELTHIATSRKIEKRIDLIVMESPSYFNRDSGGIRWSDVEGEIVQTNIVKNANQDVVFKCEVMGEQTIQVEWHVNGESIFEEDGEGGALKDKFANNVRYKTFKDNMRTRLVWKDSDMNDNGKVFSCVWTQTLSNGTQNNLTRSFTLTVIDDSSIPLTIENDNFEPLVVEEGTNFTYVCRILKADEIDGIIYYLWAPYSGIDSETNRVIIKDDNDVTNGPVLTIINVQKEDEGQYVCIVSNTLNHDLKVFNLTVRKPGEGENYHSSQRNQEILQTKFNDPMTVIIGSIVGIVIVGGIILIFVGVMKRRKPDKHPKKRIILLAPTDTYHDFTKDSSSDLIAPLMPPMVQIQGGRNRLSSEICSYSDYEFPLDEQWEIRPRNRVQLMDRLGEGAFGCVYYAELKPSVSDDSTPVMPIAVKMLKSDATDKELVDLVQELEVMKHFAQHKNIINLLGCMTRDGPLYIIVEYARHGNLRDFLRSHRPQNSHRSSNLQLTHKHLVTFAYEIASGMQYLAQNRCLHRDLAARNILVGDDYEMKIADFGLSRNIAQSDYYKKMTEGKLPIKWMAPEALLDRKYTTKSDVWAYGVLLWELFTLGVTPYPTVPHERLFEVLREGHRMDQPYYSSVDLYTIMRQCWQYHPAQRPTFSEIMDDVDGILTKTPDEFLDADCSPLTTPRESTTSPCTSTTSFSGDEKNVPPELPPPYII